MELHSRKCCKYCDAIALAFFGVELHPQYIVARYRCCDWPAMIGRRQHIRRVSGIEMIAVQEIGFTRLHHRMHARNQHIIPAHMRHFQHGRGFDGAHLAS